MGLTSRLPPSGLPLWPRDCINKQIQQRQTVDLHHTHPNHLTHRKPKTSPLAHRHKPSERSTPLPRTYNSKNSFARVQVAQDLNEEPRPRTSCTVSEEEGWPWLSPSHASGLHLDLTQRSWEPVARRSGTGRGGWFKRKSMV